MAKRSLFESLDEEAVVAVAELFGAVPQVEPYSPDGTKVYRVTLAGSTAPLSLVLWPSLRRVDVTARGHYAWVMKDVGSVEVISGVEVVFHPAQGSGLLFVSVTGWVSMVMG